MLHSITGINCAALQKFKWNEVMPEHDSIVLSVNSNCQRVHAQRERMYGHACAEHGSMDSLLS